MADWISRGATATATGVGLVLASAALGLLMPRSAECGTIITTGLPANTAIININARQDGAAQRGGPWLDLWYAPFSTAGSASLLQYTIQPGTYQFKLTNPTLAGAAYPALSSGQLSQVFTAWTYNSPWVTDYMVFDSPAVTNPALPQLFAGAVVPHDLMPGYGSAASAFNAAVTGGWADQIVTGPAGRYNGTTATQFTFAEPHTLVFAVPDYALSDNNGGVSVLITPVPEPALLSLLALGGLTLLGRRNRTKPHVQAPTSDAPQQ